MNRWCEWSVVFLLKLGDLSNKIYPCVSFKICCFQLRLTGLTTNKYNKDLSIGGLESDLINNRMWVRVVSTKGEKGGSGWSFRG